MSSLRTLFVATFIVFAGWVLHLQAAEIGTGMPISLQAGQPPEGAWESVEQELRSDGTADEAPSFDLEGWLREQIERGEASTRSEAMALLFHYDIYWGYVDLDGDGVDEMLVWLGLPGWCGTAGCRTIILGRRPASWEAVSELTLEEPTDNLCYTRAGPDGYPLIRSRREAVWWTGTNFDGVCYLACDGWGDPYGTSPEELATYTPTEFKVRDELRQLPWCDAAPAS
ncbi:hypothetical protein [Hypericibacter sp.]|uniref:hypothetical protein n=1 Tax=Hypericibacter sp. TaxID=2705401 RepID=UPI003D6D5491